jgi:invasion protein IalB
MNWRYAAGMISLLLAAAAAVAPQPAQLKGFQDWTVGCDNGRACHAVGLVP